MNKRVLSMLSAGVVAASTLLSSVPAFAAESTYVLMNIPYSVFYEAQGVSEKVDAVTSATKSKTRAYNLAKGSYHNNTDGTDIAGVTIPVKVSDASVLAGLKNAADVEDYDITVKLRGKETTTHFTGADKLFENCGDYAYYVLDETPSVYTELTVNADGSFSFSKVKGNTTADDLHFTVTKGGRHTDTEITIENYSTDTFYGGVIVAKDGKTYGLRHVYEMWRNFQVGYDNDQFGGLDADDIAGVVLYTGDGVESIDFVSVEAYTEDAETITLENYPSDIEEPVVTVSYKDENGEEQTIDAVVTADGTVKLAKAMVDGVEYTVTVSSSNYTTEASTFTYPNPKPVVSKSEEKSSSKHTHTYEWTTTKAATATTDGVMKYRCTKCGTVEYEVPISAYYVFNKDTQQAIKNAAAGATVTVETPIFISFHEMVKEALVERADVTLVVDYKNAGKSYEMTIPAGSGATLDTLFGQDKFAGFLYLGGAFATVEK